MMAMEAVGKARAAMLLLLLTLLAAAVDIPVVHASVYAGFTVGRQFEYIGKFCFTWTPTLEELAGVCACACAYVRIAAV
jgi:hypothetical protein